MIAKSRVFSGPCRLAAVLVVLFGSSAFAQSGGGYLIRKSTIDGGGAQINGGNYRATGTVGQHDAQRLTGGDYVLHGGFWAGVDPPLVALLPDFTPDKVRFVSFFPGEITSPTALRVYLDSLHHVNPPYTGGPGEPFTAFEGQIRWVGPPEQYVESVAFPVPFLVSRLQCTPHYHANWTNGRTLFVTGSAIVPSSQYRVEMLAGICKGVETTPACSEGGMYVSVQLAFRTTRWGDVETPYNPPSPTTQPDLADVSALVNKFRNAPGSPIKARALLVGMDAYGTIDIAPEFSFIHIAGCVDAFRGRPYPHTIEACP